MTTLDSRFELLHAEMREMRADMRDMRAEARELRAEMHADFASLQRQLAQIGWGMVGVLVTAMIALVVAVG